MQDHVRESTIQTLAPTELYALPSVNIQGIFQLIGLNNRQECDY